MQNLELDLSNSNSPILSTILRMRERMDGWMDDSKVGCATGWGMRRLGLIRLFLFYRRKENQFQENNEKKEEEKKRERWKERYISSRCSSWIQTIMMKLSIEISKYPRTNVHIISQIRFLVEEYIHIRNI